MKAEERNALWLLLGIGVTGAIVYAVNSKAAPMLDGSASAGQPKPGERWLVAIWLDPPEFTDADRRRLVADYSRTATVEKAEMVTQNVLGLVLLFRTDERFPPAGTTIPWGRGEAKFLRAERA
jgi:hypothetical protein